jgi:hypothetical protein
MTGGSDGATSYADRPSAGNATFPRLEPAGVSEYY